MKSQIRNSAYAVDEIWLILRRFVKLKQEVIYFMHPTYFCPHAIAWSVVWI
jgi:hypothetical protein